MIKTHCLSHIALSVADLDRSLAFYVAVFGVRGPDGYEIEIWFE
jgi:catechol 2,3-dioxygenase-like lactoylglutathione lyase family enzyme